MTAPSKACTAEEHAGPFSAEISVILAFMPAAARPVPILVQMGRTCTGCRHVFEVIGKAVSLHSQTRQLGAWSRAIVLFVDGTGLDVKNKAQTQPLALA